MSRNILVEHVVPEHAPGNDTWQGVDEESGEVVFEALEWKQAAMIARLLRERGAEVRLCPSVVVV